MPTAQPASPAGAPLAQSISTLAAFAIPALALWLPSGYSWGAVLLALAALAMLWRWVRVPVDAGTWWLVGSMLVMAALWALQSDPSVGTSRWEKPAKCVLAALCVFYVAAYPPRPWALVAGWMAGCLGAAGMACWQVYGQGSDRAFGYTNAIQFGNIALWMAVAVAVCMVCLYRMAHRRGWLLWGAVAVLAGLWASVLSLSRGGWLALLLAALVAAVLARKTGRGLLLRVVAGLAVAAVLVAGVNFSTLQERMGRLDQELAQYSDRGQAETSVGHRLEHWRMAWQMGSEKPLWGWGEQGYQSRKQELVAAGAYDPEVLEYGHAHNEVLDTYAKSGLAGVVALCLFYGVPLYLFWPSPRRGQPGAVPAPLVPPETAAMMLALRLAGLALVLLYIGFGLTQVFFAHNSGLLFYVFMVMLLWGALRGLERSLDKGAWPLAAHDDSPNAAHRPRVLHFVTGGFSGATQVALDLVKAHRHSGAYEPLLVLRKKRQTRPDRVAALRGQGIPVELVAGWSHAATIEQLAQLCRRFQPDIVVAHGFSEHLWGRYAALKAQVPHMVHVEHNSRERYTPGRLKQALWLAERTDAIVGCSQGVKQVLLELGFPAHKVTAIPNGIRLEPFAQADQHPLLQREAGIVMAARFARQKDHATLLHAIALLRQRGLRPPVFLAGGGKWRYQFAARRLIRRLNLGDQVQVLGFYSEVPALLMRQQICVLASHYEGMPLSLIEGMAAACAVVGSRVPGIQEIVEHQHNGLLAEHGSAESMADALEYLLRNPQEAARMAAQARHDAVGHYGLERMGQQYEALFAGFQRPAVSDPSV